MTNYNSLNHCTWECKYHVVFTPIYRKKSIFGLIRKELKDVFHRLAQQKECKIEEEYLMPDHVHMLISIPSKHSISSIVGFIKGKNSIWVAQNIANKQQNLVGHKFWARGYFVSTVEANEEVVRKYSIIKFFKVARNNQKIMLFKSDFQKISTICSTLR